MTVRNLDALFQPKAIAVVGASNQPHSIGAVLAANLFEGGFDGPILAVNPHERAIRSTLNYRSVGELPLVPDLAVLATPPATRCRAKCSPPRGRTCSGSWARTASVSYRR